MSEREIEVTRTVYRVSDFLSWQRAGSLDLRPPFQRLSVWSPRSQSFLIDTLLRGYPVPLLFVQEGVDPHTYAPTRRIVDGQQRLRAVLGFIDPSCVENFEEFTISKVHDPDLAGYRFQDLSEEQRQRILSFEFSVHILDATTSVKTLLEVFARMNSTGTRLNHQELRNGYSGAFRQFAYRYASDNLERLIGWRVFTDRQVARMKDVELVSELALFVLRGFRGKSQAALNALYKEFDGEEFPWEHAVVERLDAVLNKLGAAFGPQLNESYGEDLRRSGFSTQGWFYVLFAFVHDRMFSGTVEASPNARAKQLAPKRLRQHLADRSMTLREADMDADLLKALRGAATDRGSRMTRLRFISTDW